MAAASGALSLAAGGEDNVRWLEQSGLVQVVDQLVKRALQDRPSDPDTLLKAIRAEIQGPAVAQALKAAGGKKSKSKAKPRKPRGDSDEEEEECEEEEEGEEDSESDAGDHLSVIMRACDTDSDGRLSYQELAAAMERFGVPPITKDKWKELCGELGAQAGRGLDLSELSGLYALPEEKGGPFPPGAAAEHYRILTEEAVQEASALRGLVQRVLKSEFADRLDEDIRQEAKVLSRWEDEDAGDDEIDPRWRTADLPQRAHKKGGRAIGGYYEEDEEDEEEEEDDDDTAKGSDAGSDTTAGAKRATQSEKSSGTKPGEDGHQGRLQADGAMVMTGMWYELDLWVPREVGGVITKGYPDSGSWAHNYTVQHSLDRKKWKSVDDGRLFKANKDEDTPVRRAFEEPVTARYIRIYPTHRDEGPDEDEDDEGCCGLRVGLFLDPSDEKTNLAVMREWALAEHGGSAAATALTAYMTKYCLRFGEEGDPTPEQAPALFTAYRRLVQECVEELCEASALGTQQLLAHIKESAPLGDGDKKGDKGKKDKGEETGLPPSPLWSMLLASTELSQFVTAMREFRAARQRKAAALGGGRELPPGTPDVTDMSKGARAPEGVLTLWKRQKGEAKGFPGLALEWLIPPPQYWWEPETPAVWEHTTFDASFLGHHFSAVTVQAAEGVKVYARLLDEALREQTDWLGTTTEEYDALQRVQAIFQAAGPSFERFTKYHRFPWPAQAEKLIDDIGETLGGMVPGECVLLPCARCDYLMLVELTTEALAQVTVINSSPHARYHPKEAFPGRIKQSSCVTVGNVPREHIVEKGWWAFAMQLKVEDPATEELFYTHFLGWFSEGRTYQAAVQETEGGVGEQRTPCVGGWTMWKNIRQAADHLLGRNGVRPEVRKLAKFVVRHQMMKWVVNDLHVKQVVPVAHRRMIQMASEGLARAAAKAPGITASHAHLKQVQETINGVLQRVQELGGAGQGAEQPPELDLNSGTDKHRQSHLFPGMECLRRTDGVDHLAGERVPEPKYLPANWLSVPDTVSNFAEAVQALRHADRMCIRVSVQSEIVRNANFLIAAQLQQLFLRVLPVPRRGAADCIWHHSMLYAQQLDVLVVLRRLMEHWSSACFSIFATPEFDGVRITVSAVMATIADCVLRQRATDDPSLTSEHLAGCRGHARYVPTPGYFAKQAETIEVTSPEVHVQRTAVLDYFERLLEGIAEDNQIFAWEEGMGRMDQRATMRLMRQVAAAEAFPLSQPHMYVLGRRDHDRPHYLIHKQSPEFECYRDIFFMWKYFMNTVPGGFPQVTAWSHFHAQLGWDFNPRFDSFVVSGFGRQLDASARRDRHRWPSYAVATRFTYPSEAYTEDDLLHIKTLPDFGGILGQRDSELLLSYLTAPYLRIPLVLHFFANEDRVALLRAPSMQKLLSSVLFEPGRHQPIRFTDQCPEMAPTERDELLATPYGLLMNELQFSPDSVINPLVRLLEHATELDSGTVFNQTAVDILLFLVRVLSRVFNYLWFLIAHHKGTFVAGWAKHAMRGVTPLDERSIKRLEDFQAAFGQRLSKELHPMLERWIQEAMQRVTVVTEDGAIAIKATDELDMVTSLVAKLQAHAVMLYRNADLSEHVTSSLLSSFVFLTLRHTWNANKLIVPETEIYETMQVQRRRMVNFLCGNQPGVLDSVFDSVVRVATSTGYRLPRPEDTTHRWAFVEGPASLGRFTHNDPRYGVSPAPMLATEAARSGLAVELNPAIPTVTEEGRTVEVSLQTFQFTYKHGHLKALASEIALDIDVQNVFRGATDQTESFQCATAENAEFREIISLVGRDHDIHWWKKPDPRVVMPQFDREYPDDLEDAEEWICDLLDPVRQAYLWMMDGWIKRPFLIYLPDDPMRADENCAWLEAIHPVTGQKLKDIYVHRYAKSVHIYDTWTYGRRLYRSLIYASDSRMSMCFLQPSFDDRREPWRPWQRYEAGDPKQAFQQDRDCIVIRKACCKANLSGTDEQYIPARVLQGLIPEALLETHLFWQDKRDCLRGYPIRGDAESQRATHLLFVRLHDRVYAPLRAGWTQARVIRFPEASKCPRTREPKDVEQVEQEHADLDAADFIRTTETFEIQPGADALAFAPSGLEYAPSADDFPRAMSSFDDGFPRSSSSYGSAERHAMRKKAALSSQFACDDPGKVAKVRRAQAAAEDSLLLLVDLLHTTIGSPLHSVAQLLCRIEDLSHILVWTRNLHPRDHEAVELTWVHMPRLKLSFRGQLDPNGDLRLYSLDHQHLFVSNKVPTNVGLLQNIPNSVVLQDIHGELTVLVPCFKLVRPVIRTNPFSTDLVIVKCDEEWLLRCGSRYFLYPVHVSLSFLLTPTLASSLYMLLLRFLGRLHEEAFRLATSIGTDAMLTQQERQIFDDIGGLSDPHPEAHALRCKISLLTIDSPLVFGWYLPLEAVSYVEKLGRIGATCRLTQEEEALLMEASDVVTKKMEILAQRAKDDSIGWQQLASRVGNHQEAVLEGTLLDRQQLRGFIDALQRAVREKLRIRCPWDEICRLTRVFLGHIDREIPLCNTPYLKCLFDNHVSYCAARTKGETWAHCEVPPIGGDTYMNFRHDIGTLSNTPSLRVRHTFQKSIKGMQSLETIQRCTQEYINARRRTPPGKPGGRIHEGRWNFLFMLELLTKETTMFIKKDPLDGRCIFWLLLPMILLDYDSREPGPRYLAAVALAIKQNPQLVLPEWAPPRKDRDIRRCDNWTDSVSVFEKFVSELQPHMEARSEKARAASTRQKKKGKAAAAGAAAAPAAAEEQPAAPAVVADPPGPGDVQVPKDPTTLPKLPAPPSAVSIRVLPHHRTQKEALLQTACLPQLSDVACGTRFLDPRSIASPEVVKALELNLTPAQLKAFASKPLSVLDRFATAFEQLTREQQGQPPVPPVPPFNVGDHPAAQSHVARSMISRLCVDMRDFAQQSNTRKTAVLKGLGAKSLRAAAVNPYSDQMGAAMHRIQELQDTLAKLRDADAAFLERSMTLTQELANAVPEAAGAAGAAFCLRRTARHECTVWLEYLLGSLLSSDMRGDLCKLNPFLSPADVETIGQMVTMSVLAASRVGQVNKARGELFKLQALLKRLRTARHDEGHSHRMAQLAELQQQVSSATKMLTMSRSYMSEGEKDGAVRYYFDPRFLLFEFTWNIVLRGAQMEMVRTFVGKLRAGRSHVRQLIMGAGKTTVVGPLISLMAADGQRLVMQVMPQALLDFTRSILRKTFASTMTKQIFSFICDRQVEVDAQVYRKFRRAAATRGIVVTTPSSIKSIFLKFVEGLERIDDKSRPPPAVELEEEVRELRRLLHLWRKEAVLVMDEVDLLLHPLKSELNFPIGEKHDLTLAPLRWRMPIHLLDLIFSLELGRTVVSGRDSGKVQAVVDEMGAVLSEGYSRGALQGKPHLILLDHEFYSESIKPVMARWLYLWLEAHHFTALGEQQTVDYLANRRKRLAMAQEVEARVSKEDIQLLNLGHDWLHAFLPHVLQKIDRVTFGIMTPDDIKRALAENPQMPRSRLKLAIPFVGKDQPSESSEFAHPDIVIGLTVLAYRYEGLRANDFDEVLGQVQSRVAQEVGTWSQRRTNKMYERWVDVANGKLVVRVDYKKGSAQADKYQFAPSGTDPALLDAACRMPMGWGGAGAAALAGGVAELPEDKVRAWRPDEDLDHLLDHSPGKVIVVDWWAPWCPPCRMMAPVFAEFSTQFPDAIFIKINTDKCGEAAAAASIQALPTFHIYKDGERLSEVCGADPDTLRAAIRDYAAPARLAAGGKDELDAVVLRPAQVSELERRASASCVPLDQHDPVLLQGAMAACMAAVACVACDGLFTDVLPLRKLEQSNREEVDRLFRLLRLTPETIHWYLDEIVFPEYMRHQTVKLSASGHELGSSIVFPTRLGFSGTPSDLLPIDLGQCEYEPTTDGLLMHTLTDPAVICYNLLEKGWTVPGVLDNVANHFPPFHALIDTGALITGFSNLQVAKYLLQEGLPTMEGVVFLDEEDRKMILVRATGRVLRFEECGIPPERRFTFYDQVHTTGMDVPQMPNAQAALTLGKDMVFRDFAQGAYRMRGIGNGQTVQLVIIPEVYDLVYRELSFACTAQVCCKESYPKHVYARPRGGCGYPSNVFGGGAGAVSGLPVYSAGAPTPGAKYMASLYGDDTAAAPAAVGEGAVLYEDRGSRAVAAVPDGELVEIVAADGEHWLQVRWRSLEGAMRGADVRKIPANEFPANPPHSSLPQDPNTRRVLEGCMAWLMINSMRMERLQYNQLCVQKIQNVFRKGAFEQLMQDHEMFTIVTGLMPTGDAKEALNLYREPIAFDVPDTVPRDRLFDEVLREISDKADPGGKWRAKCEGGARVVDHVVRQVQMENQRHQVNYNTEMVQEQEEEKEQEQEKEEEKEVEVEKFIDLVYSRDGEEPKRWPVKLLADYHNAVTPSGPDAAPVFYPMTAFRLYRRRPLAVPDSIMLSSNFFDTRWSGERRLKNVIVCMEWTPSAGGLKERDRPSRDYGEAPEELGREAVGRVMELIADRQGQLDADGLCGVMQIALRRGVSPEEAAAELVPAGQVATKELLHKLLRGNCLRHEQNGRHFVLVALCEAEALRRVLHVRGRKGQPPLPGTDAAFGLRAVPSQGVMFDGALGLPKEVPSAHNYQAERVQAVLRFFDGELQYSDEQQSQLLRALHCSPPMQRLVYFNQVRGCRRRGAGDHWESTPVARVFRLSTAYTLLRQLALGLRIYRGISAIRPPLALGDAFRAFNRSESGALLPGEVWGALSWLGVDAQPEEVLDFITTADAQGGGTLSYPDFLSILTGKREEEEGTGGEGRALPEVPTRGEKQLKECHDAMRRQRQEEHRQAMREEEERDELTQQELFRREDAMLIAKGLTPNPHLEEGDCALVLDFTHSALPRQVLAYGRAKLAKEQSRSAHEEAAAKRSLEGKWEYLGGKYEIRMHEGHLRWSERLASGKEVCGQLIKSPCVALPNPPDFPQAQWAASLNSGGALWLRLLSDGNTIESLYKADPHSTREIAPITAKRVNEVWVTAGWELGTESYLKVPLLRLAAAARHAEQIVDEYYEDAEDGEAVPEELYIHIPRYPGYDGRYKVLPDDERVRGEPVWALGDKRIFSTAQGAWMIGKSDGVARSVGMVQSLSKHGGGGGRAPVMPAHMTGWKQCYAGPWAPEASIRVRDQLVFLPEYSNSQEASEAGEVLRTSLWLPAKSGRYTFTVRLDSTGASKSGEKHRLGVIAARAEAQLPKPGSADEEHGEGKEKKDHDIGHIKGVYLECPMRKQGDVRTVRIDADDGRVDWWEGEDTAGPPNAGAAVAPVDWPLMLIGVAAGAGTVFRIERRGADMQGKTQRLAQAAITTFDKNEDGGLNEEEFKGMARVIAGSRISGQVSGKVWADYAEDPEGVGMQLDGMLRFLRARPATIFAAGAPPPPVKKRPTAFAVGAEVRVKPNITEPSCGWGSVSAGDVGTLASIDGPSPDDRVTIDFPAQQGWMAIRSEIEVVAPTAPELQTGDVPIMRLQKYIKKQGKAEVGPPRELRKDSRFGFRHWSMSAEVRFPARRALGEICLLRVSPGMVLLLSHDGTARVIAEEAVTEATGGGGAQEGVGAVSFEGFTAAALSAATGRGAGEAGDAKDDDSEDGLGGKGGAMIWADDWEYVGGGGGGGGQEETIDWEANDVKELVSELGEWRPNHVVQGLRKEYKEKGKQRRKKEKDERDARLRSRKAKGKDDEEEEKGASDKLRKGDWVRMLADVDEIKKVWSDQAIIDAIGSWDERFEDDEDGEERSWIGARCEVTTVDDDGTMIIRSPEDSEVWVPQKCGNKVSESDDGDDDSVDEQVVQAAEGHETAAVALDDGEWHHIVLRVHERVSTATAAKGENLSLTGVAKVVSARYGGDQCWHDVLQQVQGALSEAGELSITAVDPAHLGAPADGKYGGSPALYLEYHRREEEGAAAGDDREDIAGGPTDLGDIECPPRADSDIAGGRTAEYGGSGEQSAPAAAPKPKDRDDDEGSEAQGEGRDGDLMIDVSVDNQPMEVGRVPATRHGRLTLQQGVHVFGSERVQQMAMCGGIIRGVTVRAGASTKEDAESWYSSSQVGKDQKAAAERRQAEEAEQRAHPGHPYDGDSATRGGEKDEGADEGQGERPKGWRKAALAAAGSKEARDARNTAYARWLALFKSSVSKDKKGKEMQDRDQQQKMEKIIDHQQKELVDKEQEARMRPLQKQKELLDLEKEHLEAQRVPTHTVEQRRADVEHRMRLIQMQTEQDKRPYEQKKELVKLKFIHLVGADELAKVVQGDDKGGKRQEDDKLDDFLMKRRKPKAEQEAEKKEKAKEEEKPKDKVLELAEKKVGAVRERQRNKCHKQLVQLELAVIKGFADIKKAELEHQFNTQKNLQKRVAAGTPEWERIQRAMERLRTKIKEEDKKCNRAQAKFREIHREIDAEARTLDKQVNQAARQLRDEQRKRKMQEQGMEGLVKADEWDEDDARRFGRGRDEDDDEDDYDSDDDEY